ncbi:MAG: mechanosensitive ion channel family protein [Rhizobiaceae bacterium]|nr:mechanosensitive ion channel family protein [Rhizobiaceae bacterium]
MNLLFARLFLILSLCVSVGSFSLFVSSSQAIAQGKPTTGQSNSNNISRQKDTLKDEATAAAEWNGYLQSAEQTLKREKDLTDKQFEAFDADTAKIIAEAQAQVLALAPDYDYSKRRVAELGPKPKEGEPSETEEIASLRMELGADFSKIDGQIKDARQIIVRAGQLRSNALVRRRAKFVESITTESESILEPKFWTEFAAGFQGLAKSFRLLIKDSFAVITNRLASSPSKIFLLAFSLLLGILAYFYVRRKTAEFFPKQHHIEDITRKQIATWAAAKFARFGLLDAAGLIYLYSLFSEFDLMPKRFSIFTWEIALSISVFLIAKSLAQVFLAPENTEARITNLSSSAAKRVLRTILITVAIIMFLNVTNLTAVMLASSFEVSIGLSAIVAIVGTIAVVRVLLIAAKDRVTSSPPAYQEARILRWVYMRPLLWAGTFASIIALVLGYIALAEFAVIQLLYGSIVLAILWLILELIDTNRQSVLSAIDGAPQSTGLQSPKMKQVNILAFGVLKIVAILISIIAMSLPWGYRTNDWLQWLSGAFFGFQVGGLTISFSIIFQAGALFIIGYAATRMLQSWLSNQYLPSTNIESGLRNSISTVVGYIGLVLAATMAIGAAGLDLSNLAIVAGALSVGVGFGLQSIIGNFVSGLILLAERPIKVGDWIVTGGGEGTVRKISVRSTEIQTFDRSTVVIPNSILITDPVTNWTHSSKLGRIKIAIGVGYGSDPDQVRDLLLKCFDEHESVLKNPKPSVFFLDFGDSALLFEARGFLSNIENGLGVRSDLRFAILRAMRKANIEIPYPQQDIHIKTQAPPAAKPAPRKRAARTSKAKIKT